MLVKQKMKRHAKCLRNTHANTMPHPIFMRLARFFPRNFHAKSKPAKIAYRQELPRQKLPVSENFTVKKESFNVKAVGRVTHDVRKTGYIQQKPCLTLIALIAHGNTTNSA